MRFVPLQENSRAPHDDHSIQSVGPLAPTVGGVAMGSTFGPVTPCPLGFNVGVHRARERKLVAEVSGCEEVYRVREGFAFKLPDQVFFSSGEKGWAPD